MSGFQAKWNFSVENGQCILLLEQNNAAFDMFHFGSRNDQRLVYLKRNECETLAEYLMEHALGLQQRKSTPQRVISLLGGSQLQLEMAGMTTTRLVMHSQNSTTSGLLTAQECMAFADQLREHAERLSRN